MRHRALIFQKSLTTQEEIRVWLDIHFAHQPNDMTDWQSHHTGETTIHVRNRLEPRVLDGVRACLVERIACLYVGVDFLIGVVAHGHIRHTQVFEEGPIAGTEQSNPGVHLVGVSAQTLEHRDRFCTVTWLSQDIFSIDDRGICCKNELMRIRLDGAGFGFSKS